ncbi:hypothetical protein KSP40_PGU001570 [Platanthera guangdongensis]|uniref:Uncharacterized protein n=1 Tax=Platanthera guangdongensis TaxID=2320717 RepID=A0ABR2N1L8_9ASPA
MPLTILRVDDDGVATCMGRPSMEVGVAATTCKGDGDGVVHENDVNENCVGAVSFGMFNLSSLIYREGWHPKVDMAMALGVALKRKKCQ